MRVKASQLRMVRCITDFSSLLGPGVSDWRLKQSQTNLQTKRGTLFEPDCDTNTNYKFENKDTGRQDYGGQKRRGQREVGREYRREKGRRRAHPNNYPQQLPATIHKTCTTLAITLRVIVVFTNNYPNDYPYIQQKPE